MDEKEEKKDDFPVYKQPKRMSVIQIRNCDADDESLVKMKNLLLGKETEKIFDEDNPGALLFDSLVIQPSGQKDIVLEAKDLSKDRVAFVLKEGCEYCIIINFKIQREIVMCLSAVNIIKRLNVPVDREVKVVGSFAPGKEYSHKFDPQIAPHGLMGRGTYGCKTILKDDETSHYTFEYKFKISEQWE